MNQQENSKTLKRILEHFKTLAPRIVKKSLASLTTAKPSIDLYDEDFYIEQLKKGGAFNDLDEAVLRKVVSENIDKINAIFMKHYKGAKLGE